MLIGFKWNSDFCFSEKLTGQMSDFNKVCKNGKKKAGLHK